MLTVRHGTTERTFSREDLAALPSQVPDVAQRLPGRQGSGVSLTAVLAATGAPADARTLVLTSGDGSFQTEVSRAEAEEALLVYALEGAPLPPALGGPIRFFLHDAEACRGHGDAPCANVKDLAEIRLR
jgi:Oxidoreductase molybdopterin binding domain